MIRFVRHLGRGYAARVARLHRDDGGSISILTVVAVLLLTMVLGMVMNVGRHVDEKLRMQNAADAAAYSGGLAMARALNALSFMNHLLCDVFALDAFMREAADTRAEQHTEEVLDAWETIAPVLSAAPIEKFARAGDAIAVKVPLEREMVRTYCLWVRSATVTILPVMEEIITEELIPQFQRAVVLSYPEIAQTTSMEVARWNAESLSSTRPLLGVLWRTDATPVAAWSGTNGILPIVDPEYDALHLNRARTQRRRRVEIYLGRPGYGADLEWSWYRNTWNARSWNAQVLVAFDYRAKMCQFGQIWRSYACGHLDQLLDVENANRNLPFLLAEEGYRSIVTRSYLEEHYSFVGVAYRYKLPEMLPGLFRSPIEGDDTAFAAVHVFLPTARPEWHVNAITTPRDEVGGMGPQAPVPEPEPREPPDESRTWWPSRQPVPTEWSLFSQHWTAQLVPCDKPALVDILSTAPPSQLTGPYLRGRNIQPPNFRGLDSDDVNRISRH